MGRVYSTYEAKTRFSEIIRKVQAGQQVVITYRGQEVAVITPHGSEIMSLEQRLAQLEALGVVQPTSDEERSFSPIVRRPGALRRFLAERE